MTSTRTTATSSAVSTVKDVTAWPMPDTDSGLLDGPGISAFWIRVDAPVRSKSNYRNSAAGPARTSWRELKAFAENVSLSARAHRPAKWQLPTLDTALAKRPVCVAVLLARTTLDAGNVSKSILDALEGVLVANDAEVRAVLEAVERTRTRPGFLAGFAQLSPGTSSHESVLACAELALALTQMTAGGPESSSGS